MEISKQVPAAAELYGMRYLVGGIGTHWRFGANFQFCPKPELRRIVSPRQSLLHFPRGLQSSAPIIFMPSLMFWSERQLFHICENPKDLNLGGRGALLRPKSTNLKRTEDRKSAPESSRRMGNVFPESHNPPMHHFRGENED